MHPLPKANWELAKGDDRDLAGLGCRCSMLVLGLLHHMYLHIHIETDTRSVTKPYVASSFEDNMFR